MNLFRILSCLFLALLVAGTVPTPAEAQFKNRLKQAVKAHAESKAIEKVIEKEDQAIDRVLDGPENAPGAPTSAAPTETASAGEEASASTTVATRLKPGEGAWANYDFVPGERPLFVDDFSAERVGNFPQRLTFISGNAEVVEWQGGRYLRATSYPTVFDVPLPETLPDRFTVEFDVAPLAGGWEQKLFVGADDASVASVVFGYWRAGIDANGNGGGEALTELGGTLDGQVYTVRVMVDGAYAKVYQNEQRVANVPNANLGRSNRVQFQLAAMVDQPVLLANIRVMAGGSPLYDALEAEGHVAVQGLYFDTGSDVLRPESTPTLKAIALLLQQYPTLALTIEGHTDGTGSPAANQTLSETRAEAVKASLVGTFGVDAARLDTAGFGASRPVASDDTPEGRQQNRRVELVKRS
jgi:outer membrane protein OmpA-like peptidoglycan-associated protein/ribosomal protein L12E/L44/L45/RPP1/RPP2